MPVARPTVLVLASTYPRWAGDPEPGFVHELARRLTGRFRVLALVPHAPGAKKREVLDGVEVVRYRYAPEAWETLVNSGGIVSNLRRARWKLLLVPGFVLAQAWTAWHLLRRERIDVIHAHWLIPQGLIAALLQSLPGRKVPFVATAHGSDVQALRGSTMDAARKFVVRRSAAATAVSAMLRDQLVAGSAQGERTRILPMGVDLEHRFVPDTAVTRSGAQLLFVGRLVEGKGVDRLLDAMPAVLHRVPDARLTIVGDGPLSIALHAQAQRLGIFDAVTFRGALAQSELPDLYRRASLFVAPFGRREGLGLVLVEALGCGCPVLAGDAPAVADILGENWRQHTVDASDTGALSSRIIDTLLALEPARKQAEHLRTRVMARFDWQVVADRHAQLLGECIAGGARAPR